MHNASQQTSIVIAAGMAQPAYDADIDANIASVRCHLASGVFELEKALTVFDLIIRQWIK
jgi:hypothetical protein